MRKVAKIPMGVLSKGTILCLTSESDDEVEETREKKTRGDLYSKKSNILASESSCDNVWKSKPFLACGPGSCSTFTHLISPTNQI